MTRRRRSAAAPAAEVTAAFVKLYDAVMYQQMIGIVKADGVEERYLKFHKEARRLTKKDLRAVARTAAEHFVSHANPSAENLSKEQIHRLTEAAIEYALQALAR